MQCPFMYLRFVQLVGNWITIFEYLSRCAVVYHKALGYLTKNYPVWTEFRWRLLNFLVNRILRKNYVLAIDNAKGFDQLMF